MERSGPTRLPSAEVWLAGEWRASADRKIYLSNLPTRTTRRALIGRIKARREQAHQQMTEELGLDHFEGRSWTGLHRHPLMTSMAYAYLQQLRLATHHRPERGKMLTDLPAGTATRTEPAGAVRHAIIGRLLVSPGPPVH